MKNTLSVILAVMVLLGYSVAAEADSVDQTVPLSLAVPAAFGFTLEKYSHDFGTVPTGQGTMTTIGIYCRSNHGRPWNMALNADPFSNGTDIIPSDPGFKWGAWTDTTDPIGGGQGKFPYPDGGVVPTSPTVFYESTMDEGSDDFTALTLGLWVLVPAGQPSGLYETNLILTMTD